MAGGGRGETNAHQAASTYGTLPFRRAVSQMVPATQQLPAVGAGSGSSS